MSILTDLKIKEEVQAGNIFIDPFKPENVGTNSYDLTLGDEIRVYDQKQETNYIQAPNTQVVDGVHVPGEKFFCLDCTREQITIPIPKVQKDGKWGWLLFPDILFLADTIESIMTRKYVPELKGRSSLGRIGVEIHKTAGFGDVGFDGTWTLEITCVHPVFLIPNMRIGQICFHTIEGEVENMYDTKPLGSKYQYQKGPTPYRPDPEIKDSSIKPLGRDE